MPQNFLYLGLISILFPKARLIHCQRHPLDNCVSIYFQNFITGHDYAYDLTEIGHYYLQYVRLINHWRAVLPARMFEVRYEEIVRKQEDISRELVDYCGLDWDAKCLEFYRNKRSVFTSTSQVRQPMYSSSTGRWENYREFLSSLEELLENHLP
jgi:hypothetical protein